MTQPPRHPPLPEHAPTDRKGPHPLRQPDERKEGGPDFGKARRQDQVHEHLREEAEDQAETPPGGQP